MNILFIGDIVGRVGRDLIDEHLQSIKKKYKVDFVIANGENVTHGKGLIKKHYDELLANGIDCITMGNHVFDKHEILDWIDNATSLVRPANLTAKVPGVGTKVFTKDGVTIQVTNLLGRVFMDGVINNPVEVLESIISKSNADINFVDFHAEASSEKICLGYEFDGRVDTIVGTHTHVQTADERVLDNGCAYITDVGMTGPFNECIGMEKKNILYRMKTGLPATFKVAEGPGILSAVVVRYQDNKAQEIKRISISPLNDYEV